MDLKELLQFCNSLISGRVVSSVACPGQIIRTALVIVFSHEILRFILFLPLRPILHWVGLLHYIQKVDISETYCWLWSGCPQIDRPVAAFPAEPAPVAAA